MARSAIWLQEQPVFVGEWGGTDTDLQWGQALADYMETRQLGWTAWSWSDRPRLVQPSSAPALCADCIWSVSPRQAQRIT